MLTNKVHTVCRPGSSKTTEQNDEEEDDEKVVVFSCSFNVSATYGEYLRNGSACTRRHAAPLRQKLEIKFVVSPGHNVLTLGQPV